MINMQVLDLQLKYAAPNSKQPASRSRPQGTPQSGSWGPSRSPVGGSALQTQRTRRCGRSSCGVARGV